MCTAPATFQRMVYTLFNNMKFNDVVCYLGDIVLYAKTAEDHHTLLKEVLKRLENFRLSQHQP